KKNVESRTDHVLEIGGRCLKIVIQPGEGDLSKSQVTEQAFPSDSVPPSSSPPQQEQWAAKDHGERAREVITKKIFLTVSATLNTSMFTEQQRQKITIMCPNLKREGNPDIDGSEKLTGDFTDIEKAYCYFKDILAGSDPNHDLSRSESKKVLEDENDVTTEEINELTVPSALYEYFSHTRQEQIKELRERFGVCIRSKDDSGTTSVRFTALKSPASIQEANDFFIRTFQKCVEDLKQEKIPLTNNYTLNETIMKLNARFSNLLAKVEDNQLLLRGPASEILAARRFLAEEGENSQAEKNVKISSELYEYRNGIEIDASVFKLLETALSKEIEDIKDKFDTVVEKEDSSYGQKKLIVFRPRIKTYDMSSHATESFINAFQNASAMLREKMFNTEDSTQTKNSRALSSLSYQEATGASEKKYNGRQKNNLSSEGQSKAKAEEEEDKDVCPICMETINEKETLSKCNHTFCKSCITQAMSYKQICPVCNTIYGPMKGDQPEGTMLTRTVSSSLPGYPDCGTIEITYNMNGGIQTNNHPNPGKRYWPTSRTAYLPDSKEGREILQLLRRAFKQKLIFTVGRSNTTGAEDVITWNDIHHKTSKVGGPTGFGYPDPEYLQRVRSELKAKGIE
ncbi:E3 ubiquitin-protein ligase DTX3L, partial [Antrostomus carolinensis]|uniref:E3 ubiquitin-protein ligase DTX3L n=1 Tax=Antrostomus carolinensis TaxID=279965 RepID=UPI0005283988